MVTALPRDAMHMRTILSQDLSLPLFPSVYHMVTIISPSM